MPVARRSAVPLLLLAACLFSPAAPAAESYDGCAGFIESVPATLTTQGVWCLRKDLSTSIASGNAITIAANNVTIDCNHFKLGGLAAGDASLANGIFADGRQNATIRNCGIRGFRRGISLQGESGGGHLVERNRLDNNLQYGIYVDGSGTLVQHNRVMDTGGAAGASLVFGIAASGHVIDNDIDGLFAVAANGSTFGIDMAMGYFSVARENRIRRMVPSGSGSAFGIYGYGSGTVADRNHVLSSTNRSIEFAISGSHCIGNVVLGYQIPYACAHREGNLPADP